uniref:NADH-ubiquinone oxidoreductase chain 3 n=1 Tax=Ceutorhynchus obstrictus TaxID=307131 RepID=A0A5J6KE67_9CUCU|nr:NADH dehydrogenase subunit 3 [Ceutorhynchus obstrictus]QEV84353.1 NADH dehydrogenase subunit 3 [Ceutorhynchus obstrictus]
MKLIITQSIMVMVILMILILLLNMVSKKSFKDREKTSPFECGFDPKNLARLPFSLQFFLIAIIFIIFDVELTLLLPIILIMKFSNMMNMTMSFIAFILILIFGLLHEKNQGSLNWAF